MYKIKETKNFRKNLLKLDKKILNKVFLVLEILKYWPPFEKIWNIHSLNWKYTKYFSINVSWDYRIIFNLDNDCNIITLFDIWTHSQLYK